MCSSDLAAADASPEEVSAVVRVGAALGASVQDGGAAEGDADGSAAEDGDELVRIITTGHHPHLLWVHEHLQHLSDHLAAIAEPAAHVAEQRRQPWWR